MLVTINRHIRVSLGREAVLDFSLLDGAKSRTFLASVCLIAALFKKSGNFLFAELVLVVHCFDHGVEKRR